MAGTLLTVQCEGHAQRAIETLRAVGVFGHRDGCTALPENKDNALSRSLNTRKKIAFYIILSFWKKAFKDVMHLLQEYLLKRQLLGTRVSTTKSGHSLAHQWKHCSSMRDFSCIRSSAGEEMSSKHFFKRQKKREKGLNMYNMSLLLSVLEETWVFSSLCEPSVNIFRRQKPPNMFEPP